MLAIAVSSRPLLSGSSSVPGRRGTAATVVLSKSLVRPAAMSTASGPVPDSGLSGAVLCRGEHVYVVVIDSTPEPACSDDCDALLGASSLRNESGRHAGFFISVAAVPA